MGKGQGGFRFHVSTIAVAVIGVAATLVGFAAASTSVRENDNALLKQNTAQATVVLGAYLSQLQTPLAKLASEVPASGVDPDAFESAASAVSQAGVDESVALLRQVGDNLQVVASVGPLHRTFGGPADASLVKMLGGSQVQYTQVATAAGLRWLGELFGPKAIGIPDGYALYDEIPLPPVISLASLKGIPFSGVEGAVYLGSEKPANLYFTTTRALPLSGERAVASFSSSLSLGAVAHLSDKVGSQSAPGQLLLVMDATGHLSGTTSALLPWLILGLGLGATIILDIVLAVALRRRDQALVLVGDLEAKNSELDRSLSREAEAQQNLRRAQRMEAVGKLAGGIAHDFNNLLHVVLSYASFLNDSLEPGDPMREDLGEVQRAARRAAELTRQLLIFSRRDVVRPEVVELNEVVGDAERC